MADTWRLLRTRLLLGIGLLAATAIEVRAADSDGIVVPEGTRRTTVVRNGNGDQIVDDGTAIRVESRAVILNSGLIDGGVNGVDFVNGLGSGVLNNTRTGVINSDSRGVNLGGDVKLINRGDIVGTGDQRNGTVYSDSVADRLFVSNSGLIDAGEGNQGSGLAFEVSDTTGTILNSGVVQGRTNTPGVAGNSGLSGDGLRINNFTPLGPDEERVFRGLITNSRRGEIRSESQSGPIAGFRVADTVGFQGQLRNFGLIVGPNNGAYFGNGDHTGGSVTNFGVIESDSRAFNIDGVGLVVNNRGDLLGTGNQRNGTVYADSTAQGFTLNNARQGVIDAGEGNLGAGFSVELSESGNAFTINNDGDLLGRGNAGAGLATAGDGIRLERTRVGGALDGTTVGLFTGVINNTGSITSEGANGTVGGFRAVNGVSFQGTLDNSGTIAGIQNGVYFGNPTPAGGGDHTGGVVNNSGSILSGSRAFNIDGVGLVVNNSGDILGTGNQRNGTVYADSTAQDFTLNNDRPGVIDAGEGNLGAGFSVELSESGNDFTINNDGELVGRGNASAGAATAGDGIRLERTRVGGALDGTTVGLFTGVINNTGSITSEGANGTVGGFRAVNGVSFQGTLDNSGTIAGVQNGVYFGNPTPAGGGDHTGGVVNNTGTIRSDSRAFNLDGVGLAVDNYGAIVATDRQRNGTLYVDGTGSGFQINNLAGGSIDARGGAGSGVSIQVGVANSSVGVQTGSIFNDGIIAGAGDLPIDAGVRLFAPEAGDVFQGDIVNAANGVITADAAPAVLVEQGVVFDGALINNGVIDGSVALGSGDLQLDANSEIVLDIAGGSDFESIRVAGDVVLDGLLSLNFLDTPQVGDVFDVLDFGSLSGSFDDVRSGNVLLDTSSLLVDGSVTVAGFGAFSAVGVPEPASALLVSLSGLALLGRRRRV